MNNKEIYKKTLGFSIRKLGWDVLAIIIFVIFSTLGFIILDKTTSMGLLGLGIGAIVGGIFISFLLRYVSYTCKAGQIAMMTEAVSKGKLPDDVIGAGKKVVKERFTTVAAYFAATGIIKGIFRQIGNAITAVGKAIGGDSGNAVGGTISSVINTIVDYLCDCCLGWVFYRSDEKASRATLEGAAIFFKHGKTLAKNLGRIFGIGLLSFVVVGGIFFGLAWLVMQAFPDLFSSLSAEIIEKGNNINANVPEWVSNVSTLTLICAGIFGVVMWGIIHSAFIRPFVLVGVLRNFIESGKQDKPTEESFDELDGKSQKFKELHEKLEASD